MVRERNKFDLSCVGGSWGEERGPSPSMRTPHHLPATFPSHVIFMFYSLKISFLLLCPLADRVITSHFPPQNNPPGLLTVRFRPYMTRTCFYSASFYSLSCFFSPGHIDLAHPGIFQTHSPLSDFLLVSSSACHVSPAGN